MEFYYTPYILPLVVSSLVVAPLALYSFKNRREPVAVSFTGTMVSALIWILCYILELSVRNIDAKIFWANMQFFGIGFSPAFWFSTINHIVGRPSLKKFHISLLLIIPLLTLIFVWTDRYFHIMRGDPTLDIRSGPLFLLNADYGLWHNWVFVPYQYILYGMSVVMLVYARFSTRHYYRHQYTLLTAAILFPSLAGALYVIAMPPFNNLNPTSMSFSVSGLLFARTIFSYRMLDIVPLARDLVIENLGRGILVVDNKKRIIDYNPALKSFFPFLSPDSVGIPAADIFRTNEKLLNQISLEKESSIEFQKTEMNRKQFYRSVSSLIRDRRGRIRGMTIILSDVTERTHLMEQLRSMATTDDLTGALNRRHFYSLGRVEMVRAQRNGNPLSIVLMDLDHFKSINDTFGHSAGDMVLKMIVKKCRGYLRPADIFARYGGEEFSFCLPETDPRDARGVTERLRESISETVIRHESNSITLTASFGISGSHPADVYSLDELLNQADSALYRAKRNGRNKSEIFSPGE